LNEKQFKFFINLFLRFKKIPFQLILIFFFSINLTGPKYC